MDYFRLVIGTVWCLLLTSTTLANRNSCSTDSISTTTAIAVLHADSGGQCSTWQRPVASCNGSVTCQCGNTLGDDLGKIVICHSRLLKKCNCMSFIADPTINTTVVGSCPYTCYHIRWFSFPPNVSDLDEICTDMNRTGPLCGKCAANYGPSVYSYSLNCVECQSEGLLSNTLFYIAVAFLPLTVFYILVMCCRLSVTSPSMTAYVFISQAISLPSALQFGHNEVYMFGFHNFYEKASYFLGFSIVGIWNLDFFRAVYKPFLFTS